MNFLRLQYVLLPLLFVGFVCSNNWEKNEEKWDAIIFSQQWPITACITHKALKHNSSCTLYLNMTTWSVHGLWPTLSGTMGPSFCNKSWPFIEEKILPIEPLLLKYWANIYAEQSKTSLWQHEWSKHGTCAAQIEPLGSEYKYFSKGIDWVTNYDLVAILGIWKIYPNDEKTYKAEDIFNAVKSYSGTNPIIDCFYNKAKKTHELSQIKLCFDRTLGILDCDKVKGGKSQVPGNCPLEGVIYPSSVSSSHFTYRYPSDLAAKHTAARLQATSTCSSWVCKAYGLVKAFSILSV